MSTLVVAAHPDDEVLGCGGTIRKLATAGEPVTIAILGEGITSRYEDREEADPNEVRALQERSRQAAELLGAEEIRFFGLPDNRFDTVPLLSIVKIIEGLVEEKRPHVLYTHSATDLNIDHTLTFRAALTATRPVVGHPVADLLSFEIASSTEWAFSKVAGPFNPNVFQNIVDQLDAKLAAMACYEGESREFPHPRSPEALTAQAKRFGSVAGVRAAEAFELIRSVR